MPITRANPATVHGGIGMIAEVPAGLVHRAAAARRRVVRVAQEGRTGRRGTAPVAPGIAHAVQSREAIARGKAVRKTGGMTRALGRNPAPLLNKPRWR